MTPHVQSSDSSDSTDAASETEFQFDCTFCDEVLQSGTSEGIKDEGKRHLKTHRYQELSAAFAETYGGEECQNDCGYVYPDGVEDIAGFDCPDCGFDHSNSFARQYVYWHIETK